ncbi:MAG: NAD(P)-dependent oxidoreductase [Rubrivivax sp.]|nr:NAD(P)-dependent oxidoreductase [Rubrivivax sp.]MCL4697880.1 NAD(P)-dependent oxidoreductase [Burkholderiaceae bacterium]
MRIAFVGLGAMGVPMAVNLFKAGHAVTGFDVRAGAADALVAAGGKSAASAAEAARNAELLWLMVVSGEQAESVLFDAGAAAALPKGAVVVAACTQAPALAKKTAARLEEMGLVMLDAPVSGGVAGANAAALTIMASGAEATLARARPVLEAVGKRIFDVGREAGMGSTAKMINQLLCGVHIAAAAEAMHVAERAGVDQQTMHDIISVSAGNSWMWGDRGPRMMMDEPPVTSAVDIFVKDLGIVLGQGTQMRQGLPLAAAAMQMFLAASGLGHGAADDSQVIRAYRALNGAQVGGPKK